MRWRHLFREDETVSLSSVRRIFWNVFPMAMTDLSVSNPKLSPSPFCCQGQTAGEAVCTETLHLPPWDKGKLTADGETEPRKHKPLINYTTGTKQCGKYNSFCRQLQILFLIFSTEWIFTRSWYWPVWALQREARLICAHITICAWLRTQWDLSENVTAGSSHGGWLHPLWTLCLSQHLTPRRHS